ncbi:MAG TPA: hypothetical protein VF488_06660 [Gemmatimonadaceae bacterium]
MRHLIGPAVLCAIAHSVAAAPVGTIRDAEHGFSFTVPDGFTDYPQGRGPDTTYVFARGNADEPSFTQLKIQQMHGVLGRESLDREKAERGWRDGLRAKGIELTDFDLRKLIWKSFDVEVFVSHVAGIDKKLILVTQVPLKPEAIQIALAGPSSDEARLTAELQAVLASLDGPTNWKTNKERIQALAEAIGLVVGLLVGIWWLRLRRKRTTA